MLLEDWFSVQIFFIILRETLEASIIVSVLLSFINQRTHTTSHSQENARGLRLQVWAGAVLGLVICFVIGLALVACFYTIGKDYWSYAERLWEGVFSLLSSAIITIMGIGLLRINKVMKIKWWVKLGDAYTKDRRTSSSRLLGGPETAEDEDGGHGPSEDIDTLDSFDSHATRKQSFSEKYFLAILPLVTTLREGLEAVVFIGGIGISLPPSSIPFSVALGAIVGSSIGWMLYKGGNKLSLQYFLIFLTCFLYVVSAGLASRGVWFLELEQYVRNCGGLDVSETGSGPGSYDIANSVWHVNCCNGLTDGWWMVLNALVGWTNSATYGSVSSYIGYWAMVVGMLEIKLYEEKHGVLPLVPVQWQLRRIKKKIRLHEAWRDQERQNERSAVQAERDD